MAIWNPRADRVTLLAEGSMAAWMDGEGTAICSLSDQLVMQEVPPEPGMAPLKLIPGLWTCRGRDGTGFILAGPSADGLVVSRLLLGDPPPE